MEPLHSIRRGYARLPTLMAVLLLLCATAKAAQEAGDKELQVSGGYFQSQGDASTGTASADVALGYYLSPQWQVGVRQLFSYELNDDIEDVWTGSTTAYLNHYFMVDKDDGRLQPFLGAFAGLAYSDVDATGTAGPTVGIRYLINPTTFFVTQYRYEWFFNSLDAGDETTDYTDGNHVFSVGLGFRW